LFRNSGVGGSQPALTIKRIPLLLSDHPTLFTGLKSNGHRPATMMPAVVSRQATMRADLFQFSVRIIDRSITYLSTTWQEYYTRENAFMKKRFYRDKLRCTYQ
jgi:hypothetical protein